MKLIKIFLAAVAVFSLQFASASANNLTSASPRAFQVRKAHPVKHRHHKHHRRHHMVHHQK